MQENYALWLDEIDELEVIELKLHEAISKRRAVVRQLHNLLGSELTIDLETPNIWEVEELHQQLTKTSKIIFNLHSRFLSARAVLEARGFGEKRC